MVSDSRKVADNRAGSYGGFFFGRMTPKERKAQTPTSVILENEV